MVRERLKGMKCSLVAHANFSEMAQVAKERDLVPVDGVLLDIGVSSYQLDTPDRGFSYHSDAPLDMRMDDRNSLTARDIVNTYSENDLYRIIRDYGEDKFAKNIAKHIVAARQKQEIKNNRRTQRDNKGSDTPKGQSYRRSPVKENISGYQN